MSFHLFRCEFTAQCTITVSHLNGCEWLCTCAWHWVVSTDTLIKLHLHHMVVWLHARTFPISHLPVDILIVCVCVSSEHFVASIYAVCCAYCVCTVQRNLLKSSLTQQHFLYPSSDGHVEVQAQLVPMRCRHPSPF